MGFLGNIANAAVKAAPFAAGMLHDRNEADKRDALMKIAQQRQAQQDELATLLKQAQIGHLNAQGDALRNPAIGVKYIQNDQGELVAMPTKIAGPGMPGAASTSAAGVNGVGMSESGGEDRGMASPQSDDNGLPSVPQAPQAPKSQAPSLSGTQTGVRVPVKPVATPKIDPNSPAGIAADKQKKQNAAALRPPPAERNVQLVKTVDPVTGKTSYTRGADAVGMDAPGAAGAGGGGQSLSADDRAKMVNQAKLDNDTMKAYEGKVLAGKASVGTAAGIAGALSDSHQGALGKATGIFANKATGALDPEYQRYVTAQRSYGRVMGNLQSKRYTDNQAEIERSISGLQGNDLEGTIRYKQQLRDASLADPAVMPSQGGRGGPPPNVSHPANQHDTPGNVNLGGGGGAPTREQQLWDAAVKLHGKDKVIQEVGPRPEGEE